VFESINAGQKVPWGLHGQMNKWGVQSKEEISRRQLSDDTSRVSAKSGNPLNPSRGGGALCLGKGKNKNPMGKEWGQVCTSNNE